MVISKLIANFDFVEGTFAREYKEKMVFPFVFRSLMRTFDFVEGTFVREYKEKIVFPFVFRSLNRTFAPDYGREESICAPGGGAEI